MRLTRVSLSNFRNYAQLDLEPASGLNVFLGPNAQGKSNLLEAIAMLGTGKSFRTNRDSDLIREGLDLATVGGDAVVRAGSIRIACTIARGSRGTRKRYSVNDAPVRYARFLGSIKVVTIVPSDLQLVVGAPGLRRGFINVALAQEDPRYYRALARYQKTVQQKSALLRSEDVDADLLEIYDRALIESGTVLMLARKHFVDALAREARRTHARWSDDAERLDVAYAPSVAFETPSEDGIAAAFEARLAAVAPAERARGAALAGPHRDDLELLLDGRSLAAYGSQGQHRTAVLALKVAEYTVMRERDAQPPLLLLDDVLSELDEARSSAFLAGIGSYEQAFVTATHLPDGLPEGACVRTIRSGAVEPEPARC